MPACSNSLRKTNYNRLPITDHATRTDGHRARYLPCAAEHASRWTLELADDGLVPLPSSEALSATTARGRYLRAGHRHRHSSRQAKN